MKNYCKSFLNKKDFRIKLILVKDNFIIKIVKNKKILIKLVKIIFYPVILIIMMIIIYKLIKKKILYNLVQKLLLALKLINIIFMIQILVKIKEIN